MVQGFTDLVKMLIGFGAGSCRTGLARFSAFTRRNSSCMGKARIMPANHWDWSIPVPLSQGWKVGNLLFVGGQISADSKGRTIASGDLAKQTRNCMEFIRSVLSDGGADFADVVKLNVYYSYDGAQEEVLHFTNIMDSVRREYFMAPGPVTTSIGVTGFAFEDLLIEIEAIAAVGVQKQAIMPDGHGTWHGYQEPYSHGWKVGNTVFIGAQMSADASGALIGAGNIEAQTANCFESLQKVLQAAGASMDDLVQMNTYHTNGPRYNEQMSDIQKRFFGKTGPAASAVQVRSLPLPGAMTQVDGIAVIDPDKQCLMPEGHWKLPSRLSHGWKIGNMIVCGGQISVDNEGRVIDADDVAAQTRRVFESMAKVLAEGGAKMSNLVQFHTYYDFKGDGRAITEAWEAMTRVRLEYFPDPGPAATAVRVEGFALDGLLIQIEAVAIID